MNHKTTQEKAFVKYFQIDADCSVSLTAELFAKIRVLDSALRNKQINYQMLQINEEYYKNFKLAIIKYTTNCAKDIKTQIKNHSDGQCLQVDLDYNQLDYLDGVVHSGIENSILKWSKLGFIGKNDFNFSIEKAKEIALKLTYNDLKIAIPTSEKFSLEPGLGLLGLEIEDVEEDEEILNHFAFMEDGFSERRYFEGFKVPVPDPNLNENTFIDLKRSILESQKPDSLTRARLKIM